LPQKEAVCRVADVSSPLCRQVYYEAFGKEASETGNCRQTKVEKYY
jgi:hypothetical protein